MVIADQMQNPMNHQMAEMIGQGLALGLGLAVNRLEGQNHVTEGQRRAARRGCEFRSRRAIGQREGQHVGRRIDAPVAPVEIARLGVVGEPDADLDGVLAGLQRCRREGGEGGVPAQGGAIGKRRAPVRAGRIDGDMRMAVHEAAPESLS